MKTASFFPRFVEFVPDELNQGFLYISMEYAVVVHLCACGCRRKTVTPLSPTDWKLIFDGRNVSLRPSIGNWAYPCRSHYWIVDGAVQWSSDMSEEAVADMRQRSRDNKALHYGSSSIAAERGARDGIIPADEQKIPASRGLPAIFRALFERWRDRK